MKKILLVMGATALVLSFTACGGGNKEGDAATTTPETETKKVEPHTNQKVESTATGKLNDFDKTAEIKLNSVTFDFWPAKSDDLHDLREEGKQFVRVEFTITSTSTQPYNYNYSQFALQTPKTPKDYTTFYIGENNVTDLANKNVTIEKGKPFTGALYFVVEAGAKAEDITFMVQCNDKDGKSFNMELKAK